MPLMDEIRAFKAPKGSVALWWLGQSGYIFKSPEGTLAGVDLYLSDSCAGLRPELNLRRRVPVLIEPADLQLDVFICTHNHRDHTDPVTIRGLRSKDAMQFVGPPPSCEQFRAEGVEPGRITMAWPGCDIRVRDLRLRGTFALPTDDTDVNHLGFVLQFGDRPKVWVTGDTDFHPLLHSAAKHAPDLVIICINGGFNNLSHWEAAGVVGEVKPRAAIPCHYDMFADNAVDPRQFRAAMLLRAPGVRYQELKHGEAFVFA